MPLFLKDPGATVDWMVDWAAGYLDQQTLADSQWLVAPDEEGGVCITSQLVTEGRSAATMAGGIAGHVYRVTNRITTNDGRTDERSLTISVEQR